MIKQRYTPQSRSSCIAIRFLFIGITIILVSCGSGSATFAMPESPKHTNAATDFPTPTESTPSTITLPSIATPKASSTQPPLPAGWPTRWLRGVPCRPPCWEGVTPGQTNVLQAVEILKQAPIIATVIVTTTSTLSPIGHILWDWTAGGHGGGADYRRQSSQQTIISIAPIFPTAFPLSDVIQVYGEPSHVVAEIRYPPDSGTAFYDLTFVYMSYGFALSTSGLNYMKPIPNESIRLSSPIFFVPNNEGFTQAFDIPFQVLVPWQGFKSFDFYCRDESTFEPCPHKP